MTGASLAAAARTGTAVRTGTGTRTGTAGVTATARTRTAPTRVARTGVAPTGVAGTGARPAPVSRTGRLRISTWPGHRMVAGPPPASRPHCWSPRRVSARVVAGGAA